VDVRTGNDACESLIASPSVTAKCFYTIYDRQDSTLRDHSLSTNMLYSNIMIYLRRCEYLVVVKYYREVIHMPRDRALSLVSIRI
jgi:hypothetical protein